MVWGLPPRHPMQQNRMGVKKDTPKRVPSLRLLSEGTQNAAPLRSQLLAAHQTEEVKLGQTLTRCTPVSRDTSTGRYALITVIGPCGAALSVARKCPKRSRRGVSNSPLLHLSTSTPQAPEGWMHGAPRSELHKTQKNSTQKGAVPILLLI